MRFMIFLLGLLLMPMASFAGDLSAQDAATVNNAKHGIVSTMELSKKGLITVLQAQQAVIMYTDQAAEVDPKFQNVDAIVAFESPDIKIVEAELTTGQKIVGAITFMNVLYVIAVFVFVISAIVIFKDVIMVFLGTLWNLPKIIYESLAYVASVGAIGAAFFVPEFSQGLGFLGVVGIGGSMVMSSIIRNIEPEPVRFFGIMLALSVPVAYLLASPWVGFISSVAFMGMMGFSVLVTPGCIALGFKDDKSVAPTILAALYLLTTIIGMSITNVPGVEIFRDGGIWMGSFVTYIGLLIVSSKWYPDEHRSYAFMQFVTIGLGIAAIFVGSVFGFPVLAKIGGTFFVLYLIAKLFEIPADSAVGYATLGLIASSSVGGLYFVTKAYPQLVNYLFLVG